MLTLVAAVVSAMVSAGSPPSAADPLTVSVETADADRFAAIFNSSKGHPTAEQLQRGYLDPGSYGVRIFTPDRIIDAHHLAAAEGKRPDFYARAINVCLPIVKDTTAELRATYLAFRRLFPEQPLPRFYLGVGADNSGGTAGPGAQVLGLETLCGLADTPEKLREIVRSFYAHETVHTFQSAAGFEDLDGGLLSSVLVEGAADFIATLVTGQQIDPARAAWAAPREAELWQQFEADLAITGGKKWSERKQGTPVAQSFDHWIGNYGSAPKGWPTEVGYWMGQRIWQRWYDRQADKRAAVREMVALIDPAGVLAQGRFQERSLPHE